MAKEKPNPSSVAKIANEDLRATFYYSDAFANPPNALRFRLDIANVDGSTDSGAVLVSDHVDIATEPMGPALITLRDAALADAGYIDV